LALVAVQRRGDEAVALERARQPRTAELAVDEDKRLADSRSRSTCLSACSLSFSSMR